MKVSLVSNVWRTASAGPERETREIGEHTLGIWKGPVTIAALSSTLRLGRLFLHAAA